MAGKTEEADGLDAYICAATIIHDTPDFKVWTPYTHGTTALARSAEEALGAYMKSLEGEYPRNRGFRQPSAAVALVNPEILRDAGWTRPPPPPPKKGPRVA